MVNRISLQIPNEARKAPPYERPNVKLESLIASANRNNSRSNHHQQSQLTQEFLTSSATVLTPESLSSAVRSAYDFKFVLLGSDPDAPGCGPGFYMGIGRSKIFRLSSSRRGDQLFWEKVDEQKTKFELPSGTIIYAEQVNEVRGEGRSSRRVAAMHVIDAVFVGGEDLTKLDIKARAEIVHSLCR